MKFLLALVIVLAAIGAFSFRDRAQAPVVDTQVYSIALLEIADSPAERAQGLSGREVPQDYGLLFIFPEVGTPGFWMKDMLVPIDIVWLAEDFTIVGIAADVAPSTYPKTFEPPVPVRYVLEVAAGESVRKGWSVGTKLSLPL